MKDYDVYFFDFDGTLFDTKIALRSVWRDAFLAVGQDVKDEECDYYMHLNLLQTLKMRKVKEEDYPKFVKAIVASIDRLEIIKSNVPFEETKQLLHALKAKGKRIGIVSGNSTIHIGKVLKYWGLEEEPEVLMGNDLYKNGKPSPEPILFALDRMNLEPSGRIVYVGDSLQDVVAATAAKVDGILIDRENEHPDFKGEKITSLLELLNVASAS